MSSIYQNTISQAISFAGLGIHSGKQVKINILPANVDQGIIFKRTDIKSIINIVDTKYSNVIDTKLGTTIANNYGIKIATIEHLMAALWGCGIDNAIIEIDNEEVPIMDGSSAPFVEEINKVNIIAQSKYRNIVKILKKIEVTDGSAHLIMEPADNLQLELDINFSSKAIGQQSYCFDNNEQAFTDMFRARTFGFIKDVELLQSIGLARGGSLANAIVIGHDDQIMNKEGLRYHDEFIRHKALDLIGDIFLAGYLECKISGTQPGHGINNKLLHTLFSDKSNYTIINHKYDLLEPFLKVSNG